METTSQISISAHIHHSPHIRISLHAALHRISLHINLFLLPNPSHQNFLFQNFYAHNNFFFQYSPHTPRHFLTLWYQNIHNITQTRSKAKPFSFTTVDPSESGRSRALLLKHISFIAFHYKNILLSLLLKHVSFVIFDENILL